jgi:hypothetical protein
MKDEFAEPICGWMTLKQMHQFYLEYMRGPLPRSLANLTVVTPLKFLRPDFHEFMKAADIALRRRSAVADQAEARPNNFVFRPAPPPPPTTRDYALAASEMQEDFIGGRWFAIGRRVGKRKKELLIPPGHWKLLRANIETGTAGRGALLYEDLRCANILLAKPTLQKMVKDALGHSELWKNGQPGRPSKMTLILEELHRRIQSHQLLPTRAAEARHLVDWLKKSDHPKDQRPAVRSVTNAIEDAYRAAKAAPTSKRTKF